MVKQKNKKVGATVTKKDLIAFVAKDLGMTRVQVSQVFDKIIEIILKSLKEKKVVNVMRIFKFSVRHVSARKLKNPLNGKPINLPACDKIGVRLGAAFKNFFKKGK